jgi:hypothetical protein
MSLSIVVMGGCYRDFVFGAQAAASLYLRHRNDGRGAMPSAADIDGFLADAGARATPDAGRR